MNTRAASMLLALAALWGSSYLFIKIGVDDGLSPAFISFTRLALGALVLIPVAAGPAPSAACAAAAAPSRSSVSCSLPLRSS